jgi:hypothetical protein
MPGVGAPFPDIAMEIIQSEGIGRELTNGGSFFSIFSLGFVCIGMVAIIIG